MSVTYLRDRYPKADLARKYPDVTEALSKRLPVMMENGKETVAWVGIAQVGPSNSYFFLPHGAPEPADDRDTFARTLMKAIVRFSREYNRQGDSRDMESATLASLLAELAADYRDHGLHTTREKLRGRQDGKPDWARTLKTRTALPSGSGAPVYCDIESVRYSSFATNTVARIQEHVIAEISRDHGWWLSDYFGNRPIPHPEPLTSWQRDQWARILRLARRDLYESRALRLVGMLIDYLEHAEAAGEGVVFCGISDFSTMWEVMLRETLPDVDSSWNSRLPKPAYIHSDGASDIVAGMQPDIVIRTEGRIIILDAKYYRAISKDYVPGVQDISKQLVYQMAVEAVIENKSKQVNNAFVFPSMLTGEGPYEEVRFQLSDGKAAAGFANVKCQYVSITEVAIRYVQRTKSTNMAGLGIL